MSASLPSINYDPELLGNLVAELARVDREVQAAQEKQKAIERALVASLPDGGQVTDQSTGASVRVVPSSRRFSADLARQNLNHRQLEAISVLVPNAAKARELVTDATLFDKLCIMVPPYVRRVV